MNTPTRLTAKPASSIMARLCLASLWMAPCCAVAVGAQPSAHQHPQAEASAAAVPARSEHAYQVPDVRLMRQDGKEISLPAELNDGRAVIVNFVFTSCSAICPMLSQVFAQIQAKLGKGVGKVHLVSFSIDPEQDTPERLRAFGERFKAQPGWDFYTGSIQAITELQKAFDVYRGDKMNHEPVLLLRKAPDKPWIRFQGFVSPKVVIEAYQSK